MKMASKGAFASSPNSVLKTAVGAVHPRPIDHQCLSASKSLSPVAITVQISGIANRVIHSWKNASIQ
jgi:hypothetical protein